MDPSPATSRPAPVAGAAATVGALVTLATTFLPWASSGDRARSSYQLVDVADRAGILTSSYAGLSNLWYLLPALGGVVLVARATHSVRLAALATGTIGVLVVAGGVLVARSPLVVEPGLVLAVGIGGSTGCTGIGTLIMTRRKT